jgi:hypothetical protein
MLTESIDVSVLDIKRVPLKTFDRSYIQRLIEQFGPSVRFFTLLCTLSGRFVA